jgi:hypothetical protein
MLDLRFTNTNNKNKNSKYEKGDKYIKFQRLYKRYEKEIEGKYKKDIPKFKKLKKNDENYKAYKRNINEGRRGFLSKIFTSKNNLSEQSKRELFILTKKMEHLDLYFELKRDLSELFAHIAETLSTKAYASGESRDYSSRIDPMIEKLNKFRTIKVEESVPTSGGKKRKVVKKKVTKRKKVVKQHAKK